MDLDGKLTLKDSFNYQVRKITILKKLITLITKLYSKKIDIIVPNAEKIFDKVRTDIFDEHRYYLLKNVSLSKLLTKEFNERFLKDGK